MTKDEIRRELGIRRFRKVGEVTVVVEFAGGVRPVSPLEKRMLNILDRLADDK